MKIAPILEKMAAEAYNKKYIKIKFVDAAQTAVKNIVGTVDDLISGKMAARYPNLKNHLNVLAKYIPLLDKNTRKIFDVQSAGWDILIDLSAKNIIIKNDQGQIIKQLRL